MTKSFSAQVDDFIKNYKERLVAVAQTATQSVIDDAQTPTGKGGRMRVDTGFLRASGQASLNEIPKGPSRKPDTATKDSIEWEQQDATLTIAEAKLGDDIYFGWTANYAKYREAKDAFLALATQKWQAYVDKAVVEARRRIR